VSVDACSVDACSVDACSVDACSVDACSVEPRAPDVRRGTVDFEDDPGSGSIVGEEKEMTEEPFFKILANRAL
jgi:hypothetical protein